MESIGIIGFGRFGRTLAGLLHQDFTVNVYDPHHQDVPKLANQVDFDAISREKTIFVAVPIHAFLEVIRELAGKLDHDATVIDVCSVKMHPVAVMQEHLPKNVDIIATHPMFGPDSIHQQRNPILVMHNIRNQHERYAYWRGFFAELDFQITEMTPEEHDKLAAQSQVVTHFIGRALHHINYAPTPIDTLGSQRLHAVEEQVRNDTWELFSDMLRYNPFARAEIDRLIKAMKHLQAEIH